MITDDGIAFIEEKKFTPYELKKIKKAEDRLDELEEFYGTLNAFELMEENISEEDMFDYLSARFILHRMGWTKEEDLI